MQNVITTQVIIAGAGPTGLSMAAQLIRLGIDFVIIEKNSGVTALSKALVVQARTLEIFRELGLADEAVSRGRITTGMNMFHDGRQVAAVDLAGLGKGISAFPFALSLEQSKTERLLAEHVTGKGRTIHWNCTFTRLEQNEDHVTAWYTNPDGEEQAIQAPYLVGCDGAGSPVRHQLDIHLEGTTEPKLFYVADVLLNSPVINKSELYMYMIAHGFVLFFPMEGAGHYRIVGVMPAGSDAGKSYSFEDVRPLIEQDIVSPVEFTALRWFSTYKVHSRKAGAFMQGRCFIAGDAAHIHTPAGGQGMNTGIQDAYNLAWKLAGTLKGVLNAGVLDTYNTERTANAAHLLQTTDRMFDVMSGVNAGWNFLRLHVFPFVLQTVTKSGAVKKRIFPLISQTGIAYPDSSLTLHSAIGKVSAGDRMHYFTFTDGSDIFSYLTAAVFKLVFFGAAAHNDSGQLSACGIPTVMLQFEEIPEELFGGERDFYILLRPDNHVSYIGKDLEKCSGLMSSLAMGGKTA